MSEVFKVYTPEETYKLGKAYGEKAKPGAVYALDGDLGVGKTVWIKGFADGLGVMEDVVSPTFTIIQEYESGRIPMYHFDVYRIDDPDELYEVGIEEYLYGQGVTLIEWAERIPGLLPRETVRIRIEQDPEEGTEFRRIEIKCMPDEEKGAEGGGRP